MINEAIFADATARFSGARKSADMFARNTSADPQLDEIYREIKRVEEKIGVALTVLFEEDERYPHNLRSLSDKERPAAFIAAGNLDLLSKLTVGICGSRKASDRGLSVASELCGELATKGVTIASGYAAGVDEAAHLAALVSGGTTICVLAEGIFHFRIKRAFRDIWDWDRVLVLSQFGFSPIWQAGRAMQRNKTIVGMSGATVVVEARDRGGTLDAGQTALRYKRPLFVAEYSGAGEEAAGNRSLLGEGAVPLRRSRATGRPSTASIEQALIGGELTRVGGRGAA